VEKRAVSLGPLPVPTTLGRHVCVSLLARLTRPTRLRAVTITEYFPVPEGWFVGRKVKAPGPPGRHRVDWLYSGEN